MIKLLCTILSVLILSTFVVGNIKTREASDEVNTEESDYADYRDNNDGGLIITAENNGLWMEGDLYVTNIGVTVKNTGAVPVSGWRVNMTLPKDSSIQNSWNGNFSLEGTELTVTPMDYNSYIPSNGEQSFGFIVKSAAEPDLSAVTGADKASAESADDGLQTAAAASAGAALAQKSSSREADGVSAHGQLRLEGTQLVGEKGETVVLKGMSSHGIAWFPEFIDEYSVKAVKSYGANLFRVAMYTEEYNGYTTSEEAKANNKALLYKAVDNAVKNDMYTIIDWHILQDNNPQTHKAQAIAFFDEVSKKYADNPAVIYEICNEPHGVSWAGDIKPYAEEVIRTIRKNSPNSIIVVGTNTWSQDVDEASKDKLDFDNIMYAFHFYAGTHTLDSFKGKIEAALANGAPVFVTEWGTTQSSGDGGVYIEEAEKWLDYLNEKNISWANWSLCNKAEDSAALKSGADAADWGYDDLSESGRFVVSSLGK